MSDANAPDYVANAQRDDGRPAADLVAEYEAGTGRLAAALDGLSNEQMRARPVPGKWSMLELLCHLADCEQMYAERIKRTLGHDRPLLMGMDPVEYARDLRYNDADPALTLDQFRVCRAECGAVLRRCDEAAWRREAVHSETGVVTLRQLVLHAARHLDHHWPFIQEKRSALGA